ncbi:fatty acid synthase-like isoform X2 [Ciona intestinalis]
MDKPNQREIWFICSGMGSQWKGMGISLLKIPVFSQTIDACTEALKGYNFNVKEFLLNTDSPVYEYIHTTMAAITAIQIGLIDVLRSVGVRPSGIIGHSAGEIVCGYADECLTSEETIRVAYLMGKCITESNLPTGAMALVALSLDKYLEMYNDSELDLACENGDDSIIVAGPVANVLLMAETLNNKHVFTLVLDTKKIAYHSRLMQLVHPTLLQEVTKVIPNPKPLSKKWISTSVDIKDCNQSASANDKEVQTLCSGEYYANNFLNVVRLQDALKRIPENAITIEIAPRGMLQSILKRAIPNCERLIIADRGEASGIETLCACLDRLRSLGQVVKNELRP